ncbi:DMT family transporter [bacterium]|nr:DMT family transporter [bacterium]
MTNVKTTIAGYIYAILAVLFWSFNVIVARYFADTFTPWQISFYRWFFASITLLPFCLKSIIKDWSIITKNFKILFWLSLTGIVLMNTFSYYAGRTITAVEMSLIGVMGPVFIVILSRIFLHEYITRFQLFGIIVSFIGVITIILHGQFLTIGNFTLAIGDFWMSLLALSFAIYSVISKFRPKEISQLTSLAFTVFFATIVILPLFIYDNITHPITHWDSLEIWTLIYMGVFNSVLSYLFWNLSLEKIGSLKSSMIYYLMPVFSSIEAYFLLGENIYPAQIYGGMLVILGIFMTNKKSDKVALERP